MFKKMLLLLIVVLLSMYGPLLAQRSQVWWSGGTSSDVSDVANWVDATGSAAPALGGADATGQTFDIVRIGTSAGLTGGYEVFTHNTQPVLSTTYPSPDGNSYGGWWFVLNNNILTLEDGAFLIMNRDNCNLRNGGRLEVQGRSDAWEADGPSLILANQFRIGENGSVTEAAAETSQLRVSGTGYVQVDPLLRGTGAAFMIGTSDDPGTMPRGELIIENSGRIEILEDGVAEMYLDFGNADPSVNQIIIRDDGELSLYGDPATMGRVGADDAVTSLQEMIDGQLIINDQEGTIEATGTSPTIIKATGITGIDDKPSATPLTYALMQNYPNPFNPSTKIKFSLPYQTKVRINVYDLLGKKVAELINGEKSAGTYEVNFDAKNLSGGVYIYQLEYSGQVISKKMLLIK